MFLENLFVTPAVNYIGRANVVIDDEVEQVNGGVGGELIISYNL